MVLIGGAEERAAIQWERSMWENNVYEHMVRKEVLLKKKQLVSVTLDWTSARSFVQCEKK
jgi:hypothetical protein